MTETYKLYGMAGSLYTGKVRSYLRKQHITYEEIPVGWPRFGEKVVPQVGRFIMPVLETPNGTLIQDGADIIDYFETRGLAKLPAYPQESLSLVLAHLFELFGGEGLLRPAMHYRWNFDEDNLAFLREDFCSGLAPGADAASAEQFFSRASGAMRKAAGNFGVNADTAALVEERYKIFLNLFSEHLASYPYLLGHRPSLGDYGLIGPLYAHLARDPHPANLMKQIAPKVYRWTERMNAPDSYSFDYPPEESTQALPGEVPESLKNLMRYIASDYLPELAAHIQFTNQWLAERPDLKPGTNGLENPAARAIGRTDFALHGQALFSMVMPYRFYLLQRLQAAFGGASSKEQDKIKAVFEETGLSLLLTLATTRPVERRNHLEVWGENRLN